jgi:hypothetical protein
MYIKSPNDNVFLSSEIEEYSSVKIARSNELVTDLENQLMKTQKLLELAKQDKIKTIKNEVRYFEEELYSNYIQTYIDAKNKGDKIRKNSETYKSFVISQNYFRKMLGNDKLEITNFMKEGHEGYSNIIEFSIENHKFNIKIPILEKCTVRNFTYMNECKLTIYYYERESVWDFVCSSYDEKELAEKFNEFLNKNET